MNLLKMEKITAVKTHQPRTGDGSSEVKYVCLAGTGHRFIPQHPKQTKNPHQCKLLTSDQKSLPVKVCGFYFLK